jgi:predicted RNA-binding Zn-ribbon protein involved in translation (DUF1610 family)
MNNVEKRKRVLFSCPKCGYENIIFDYPPKLKRSKIKGIYCKECDQWIQFSEHVFYQLKREIIPQNNIKRFFGDVEPKSIYDHLYVPNSLKKRVKS